MKFGVEQEGGMTTQVYDDSGVYIPSADNDSMYGKGRGGDKDDGCCCLYRIAVHTCPSVQSIDFDSRSIINWTDPALDMHISTNARRSEQRNNEGHFHDPSHSGSSWMVWSISVEARQHRTSVER